MPYEVSGGRATSPLATVDVRLALRDVTVNVHVVYSKAVVVVPHVARVGVACHELEGAADRRDTDSQAPLPLGLNACLLVDIVPKNILHLPRWQPCRLMAWRERATRSPSMTKINSGF